VEEIIRREFWREFEEVQRRVNQIFEEFFSQTAARVTVGTPIVFSPPVNICQIDKELIVQAVIPGALQEDIDITVEGRIITIRGELTEPLDCARAEYHLKEWRYGYFERQLALPYQLPTESARASYTDGILEIRFRLPE
jgi:HSP20 family protein